MSAGRPPARVGNLAEARRRHDPVLVDRLVQALFETDVLADAAVDELMRMPAGRGRRLLDQALRDGPSGMPAEASELCTLLAPITDPPDWVDFHLVDAGAVAYWRSSRAVLATLACASLARGYQSAGLVKPLALTGRIERLASKRLLETSGWLALATPPGEMRPGAEGLRATVHLRLMHALQRRNLRRSPKWDRDAWGEPINVFDSCATVIGGFLVAPVHAMQDVGLWFSDAELQAMTHLWRWIGANMGVPDDLLPRSFGQAEQLLEVLEQLDAGPDEDSRRMLRALLHEGVSVERFLPPLTRPLLRPLARTAIAEVLAGLSRRWVGANVARALHLRRTPSQYLPPLIRPLVRAREAARVSGLLGSDRHIAEREVAAMRRVLARQAR